MTAGQARRALDASLVATALLAAACGTGAKPPVVAEGSAADTAEQIILDGRTMLTESGVKRGELFADTIYVFNDQTRFALRRVRSKFNTETGAPNGTLRGDRGTYDLRTRVLEGYGNVVVESTDGKRLTSNHLKYAEATNLISSDSAFTMSEPGRTQRGIGFTSDPNLNSFRCFRACSATGLVPLSDITRP